MASKSINSTSRPMATLPDEALQAYAGGNKIACFMGLVGAGLWVASTFATAGAAAVAGTVAEWGLICGCSTYIDRWFGSHFTGSSFCG